MFEATSYLLGKKAGGGSQVNLQNNKQVSITSNGSTEISPDETYDGMKKVTVTTNVPTGGKFTPNVDRITISDANATNLDDVINDMDVKYIENMNTMFGNCTSLTRLDLSSWNVSNVVNTSYMFNNCVSLQFIDLRTFDFSRITNYTNMFGSSSYIVPTNCLIIVADNTQKQWLRSKFSSYTNVKTVEEYEQP